MIQRDKTFIEWLKKERLKTEKSQRKKGNSGTPPQNQREISSRDKNSKRPRVKEIFKMGNSNTFREILVQKRPIQRF